MIPVTNGNGGASDITLNVLKTFTYVNKGLAQIIKIQLQLQKSMLPPISQHHYVSLRWDLFM